MTAVNIPDMIQIVKEHGLVPVPLDLNLDTMEPISVDALKQAITPKV
jgi:perosamine synthetase